MKNENYYEPRYISQTNEILIDDWLKENRENQILKQAIFEYDKIILLGNPGIGKSRELDNLFKDLWEEKEGNGLIPFAINLKFFRSANKFEDLIPYSQWKELPSIIFILDGLDEIAEIQDFISAFEIFIQQNKLLNIKYVLSCRTNIFEKYLINISNFNSFFLDDLTIEQSKNLLNKKYGFELDELELEEKHLNYLKTPFFLDLFASYVSANKILPQSDSEMWELYVKKTLDVHEKKQIKKKLIDRPHLIKDLKKVAFVNELMQQNFSTEEQLNQILGGHLDFIDNPFSIEILGESKRWNFEHRQIQEYFVAKTLSEKDLDEILSIIKIANIDKEVIHPSLFNTITFLINLLDKESDKFKNLICWIQENQIELLFKADSDRTTNFKVQVFQYYFYNECIVKTFWITTNRLFSVKEIAKFGNCEKNYIYLIDLINDKTKHFRVHISALDLLSFFSIPPTKKNPLKDNFITLLNDPEVSMSIKSHIINCINVQNLCKGDDVFLKQIFEIFEKESNKELNRSLLSLLFEYEHVDDFFEFIKSEFFWENNIVKREDIDEVSRGNSWILEEIILKISNSNNFIEIIKYYFMDEVNIRSNNSFVEKLMDKSMFFSELDSNFLTRLLKSFSKKSIYNRNDVLLREVILRNKEISQIQAFEYIIDNNPFSRVVYFLTTIVNEKTINIVIEKYNEGKIDNNNDIEYFRNIIGNNGKRELAKNFNDLMIKNNFEFKEKFLDEEEFQSFRNKYADKLQQNFDILFDLDSLLKEIKNIFKNNTSIDSNLMHEIDMEWYNINGHGNTIDSSYSFLEALIWENGTLTFEDVKKNIKDDFVVIKRIKTLIEQNKTNSNKIIINDKQKERILEWFLKNSEDLDFNNIMKFIDHNHFTILPDYEKLKHILFFHEKFNFELSSDFILNSTEFFDVDNSIDDSDDFEHLLIKLGDKKLFDERIIHNIMNKDLFSFSVLKHIRYALKNKLSITYPKIKQYLLMKEFDYNIGEILEDYIELTDDIELLKQCSLDIKSHKFWTAIKILMGLEIEKKHQDFCFAKAIEYLELEIDEVNKYYISDALGILFKLNKIEAIEYFYTFLKKDHLSSINENSFSKYDVIENFEILEKLFYEIYLKERDMIRYNTSSSFLNVYISNLSKNEISYNKTQEILDRIKSSLIKEDDLSIDKSGLFYINLLIDNSNKSYINSKSKPLTFNEALEKVNVILG